jgi:hypothetical protein
VTAQKPTCKKLACTPPARQGAPHPPRACHDGLLISRKILPGNFADWASVHERVEVPNSGGRADLGFFAEISAPKIGLQQFGQALPAPWVAIVLARHWPRGATAPLWRWVMRLVRGLEGGERRSEDPNEGFGLLRCDLPLTDWLLRARAPVATALRARPLSDGPGPRPQTAQALALWRPDIGDRSGWGVLLGGVPWPLLLSA